MQTLTPPGPALFPTGPAEWGPEADETDPDDPGQEGTREPDRPRTSAVVRRTGAPTAGTSAVEFPDHPGIGGTLHYLGGFPPGFYNVTDHLGEPITAEPVATGLEAVTALARHYGLPMPVQVIPRGPRGSAAAPARPA
ncbi:hypothetical protein [Kitasatospora griseola]|uniref:hypothetical protein n=1 Tax=Kitasatospora griseola TaxID=2064 RepID=UPI00341A0888